MTILRFGRRRPIAVGTGPSKRTGPVPGGGVPLRSDGPPTAWTNPDLDKSDLPAPPGFRRPALAEPPVTREYRSRVRSIDRLAWEHDRQRQQATARSTSATVNAGDDRTAQRSLGIARAPGHPRQRTSLFAVWPRDPCGGGRLPRLSRPTPSGEAAPKVNAAFSAICTRCGNPGPDRHLQSAHPHCHEFPLQTKADHSISPRPLRTTQPTLNMERS